MVKSIVIAGVGGQGTLLASKILASAAGAKGLFVRTSETIGMAQRGGCVSSHLRIDAREVSPIIPSRSADILLGFELAESVRMIPKLKKDAKCAVNCDKIIPTNVALGKGVYLAEEYLALMKEKYPDALFIDCSALALKAGDIRTLNIVILGAAAASGILPFTADEIREAMTRCVKPKLLALNEKAFALGLEAPGRRW
ncbi:MAG: indolepyruvate oxidoreductase subunit beta [Synergistes sp.]|nr:indolepyruvate oxidoreductase subunit beta [Synergistes sp.]